MIRVPITEDSLRTAYRRIQDFSAVHHGQEDYDEAFTVLRESLGIDIEMIATMTELTEETIDSGDDDKDTLMAGVLFGLMMGLIASDYASET